VEEEAAFYFIPENRKKSSSPKPVTATKIFAKKILNKLVLINYYPYLCTTNNFTLSSISIYFYGKQ